MTPKSINQNSCRRTGTSDYNRIFTAKFERIAATIPGLSTRLKPVISCARAGVVANTPGEARAYLIGALHALRLTDDDFFTIQDALEG